MCRILDGLNSRHGWTLRYGGSLNIALLIFLSFSLYPNCWGTMGEQLASVKPSFGVVILRRFTLMDTENINGYGGFQLDRIPCAGNLIVLVMIICLWPLSLFLWETLKGDIVEIGWTFLLAHVAETRPNLSIIFPLECARTSERAGLSFPRKVKIGIGYCPPKWISARGPNAIVLTRSL